MPYVEVKNGYKKGLWVNDEVENPEPPYERRYTERQKQVYKESLKNRTPKELEKAGVEAAGHCLNNFDTD